MNQPVREANSTGKNQHAFLKKKKKKVYLWFLYLVIPEINCLHHNILYVLESFSD